MISVDLQKSMEQAPLSDYQRVELEKSLDSLIEIESNLTKHLKNLEKFSLSAKIAVVKEELEQTRRNIHYMQTALSNEEHSEEYEAMYNYPTWS